MSDLLFLLAICVVVGFSLYFFSRREDEQDEEVMKKTDAFRSPDPAKDEVAPSVVKEEVWPFPTVRPEDLGAIIGDPDVPAPKKKRVTRKRKPVAKKPPK